MALYIAIRKRDENNEEVTFEYFTTKSLTGTVAMNKLTGAVSLVRASPNDLDARLFSRVAYKLKKHWEKGEIPEETCWAS